MYENGVNSYNVISKPRLVKPFVNTPRSSLNFWRRPQFPFSRRGIMPGQYPSMGLRNFSHTMHRPNFATPGAVSPGLRYPMSIPRTAVPPFVIQRPPFYMPVNVSDNKSSQLMLPTTIVNEEKLTTESAEPKSDTSELNAFSDLWVESLGPGGRICYYNTRTRESTWKKPINDRIIELNEIEKLSRPQIEHSEKFPKDFNCMELQRFSNNYSNDLSPKNFPMPGLIFPPNVSFPPPNFSRSPLENVQNRPSCNVRFIMPPLVFPITFVANNLLPTDVMHDYVTGINQDMLLSGNNDECASKVTQDSLQNTESDSFTISEHNLLPKKAMINNDKMRNYSSNGKMNDCDATVTQNRFPEDVITDSFDGVCNNSEQTAFKNLISDSKEVKFVNSVNDKTSFNTLESNVSLSSSSDSIDLDITEYVNENTIECNNEKLGKLKSKCSLIKNTKSENSGLTELKYHQSPVKLTKTENPTGNSRSVSCTPIYGTNWCVVWTGDQRVFFYNPQLKVSVWERPTELSNRSDVDKMVKTFPLLLDLKPLTKEVRKNSSDHLDTAKKMKKDNEIYENSDLKESSSSRETVGSVIVHNDQTIKNNLEVENILKSDTLFSHEQRVKMFCDMLLENKVSIFSTWEKEVHKIAFDFRYLLLPEGEKKQVFAAFVKGKYEEEMLRLKKEYQSQKEAFISLLVESGITSKSIFSDISDRYADDFRFRVIEDVRLKKSLFEEYISELGKNDQEREKYESVQKRNFVQLLSENSCNCIGKEWSEVQNILADDERFKTIHDNSLKENLFKEYIRENSSAVSLVGRQMCANSNCEEEGKRDSSIYLKDQEKEQENYSYTRAISNFKALLEDLIKYSDVSWLAAEKVLKADHRWKYSQDLESEKCKELFAEYTNILKSQEKDQFYCLLGEFTDVTEKTSWLDIRGDVLKDLRCARFSSSERRCEREFKVYLRQKLSCERTEFKQLLKETKSMLHKSKSFLNYSNHTKDIKKDVSQVGLYLNLDCVPSERKEILLNYIKNLNSEG